MYFFRGVLRSFEPFLVASAFVAGVCLLSAPAFSEEQKENLESQSSQKTSQARGLSSEPKKETASYIKTCPEAGFGFFSLSNETCIRIGGFVRGEAGYEQPKLGPLGREDALATYARGRIEVDGRTATDYGPLRVFVRYELTGSTGFYRVDRTTSNTNLVSSLDKAFIQFLHFTVGRNQSFFDFYADALNFNTGVMYGLGSDYGTANLAAYSAKINKNLVATLSLEDRNQRNLPPVVPSIFSTAYYNPSGQRFPDVIGAVSWQDAWGTAQLSGALHYLEPMAGPGATQRPKSKPGFAAQLGTRLNMDKVSAGDVLWLQGAYVKGALSYLGIGGNISIGPSFVPMTDAIVEGQTMTLTTGYGGVAAYQHQWAPNIRQALFGNYTVVEYKGRFAPLYAVATTRIGTLGTNLTWSPIPDLDLGVEVLYSKFSRGKRVLPEVDGPGSAHRLWAALRVQKAF